MYACTGYDGITIIFILEDKEKWTNLWKSASVSIGILALLFVFKGSFSFAAGSDRYLAESYGPEFIDALKLDRKTMFTADLLRSSFLILMAFGVLWLSIKNTISHKVAVIIVGIIMISDLFFIDKNYLNNSNFVSKQEVEQPIEETELDATILKDKSYYRVFEVSQNVMSDPRASYFHKSIGGYSAVKPKRMQDLFDYQIANNNMEVINMLNVKYLIQTNKKGEKIAIHNTQANGNAWFIKNIVSVKSADAEMKALNKLDTKNKVVIHYEEVKESLVNKFTTEGATIKLTSYEPNDLKYISNNTNNGFAVFSEMYYKNGWNAYIDGKLNDHYRVDYALRGLPIPKGKHTIEFKFEPQVIKTGSMISLISFIGILLLLGGGVYYETKRKKA